MEDEGEHGGLAELLLLLLLLLLGGHVRPSAWCRSGQRLPWQPRQG
jgi:hypothetical protein